MSYPNQPPQWQGHNPPQTSGPGGVPGPYGPPGAPGQYPQYGPGQSGPGPYGPGGAYGPPVPEARNNVPAAIILILGGLLGVVQAFLPWVSMPAVGSLTGFDLVSLAGDAGGGAVEATIFQVCLIAVLVCGGLLLIAGASLVVPMRNRKVLGALSLLVTVMMTVAVVLLLVKAGLGFSGLSVGFYCFLASAVICWPGSLIALFKR
ncbi:hypothetical protein [Amycolatopsis rhizosphaerae]|nr:hypothetical protein [Amycolatopsis rhizosphaerae]